MSAGLTPIRIADDVFELPVASPAHAQSLAKTLRDAAMAEDIVAGLASVCVSFSPDQADEIETWLTEHAPVEQVEGSDLAPLVLPIEYGGASGPDFDRVCAALKLSPSELIAKHTAQTHTVEMIGFTPGFAYISGLSERLEMARLSDPRARVPAGSVGLSGKYTGIYALAGPGGWPLIGRIAERLFVPESDPPFLLSPGQRVTFEAA